MSVSSPVAPPPNVPVDRLLALPPFPAVARKLMVLLAKPNVTIPEVSQLVRSDAVFAAEVLRLANSAMMSLRFEVVSIMHAISVLGMDRLKNLVMTVAMRDFIRGARQIRMLRLAWRHNLAGALMAEALAEACSLERPDAYTAGLLHDLGRLALIAAWPAEYEQVLAEATPGGEDLLSCEARIVGIDHQAAGEVLGREWGLPGSLRELLCLRNTASTGPFTLIRLAQLCCRLSDRVGFPIGQCGDGWDLDWLQQQLPPAAWARFSPKANGLRESVLIRVNAFEAEFLPG